MSERVRAIGAAGLLLIAGIAMGIVADRTVLAPPAADASAITFESLAQRLDLSSEDAARLRTLLDSLHTDVMGAVERGPGALGAATEAAHDRIEASLSPEARSEFRAWLEEHRRQMMRRMHAEMTGG